MVKAKTKAKELDIWGVAANLKKMVNARIKDMDRFYHMSESERISDPEVSEIHARKGDEIMGQIMVIKETVQLFGLSFEITETNDGDSRMTDIQVLKKGGIR